MTCNELAGGSQSLCRCEGLPSLIGPDGLVSPEARPLLSVISSFQSRSQRATWEPLAKAVPSLAESAILLLQKSPSLAASLIPLEILSLMSRSNSLQITTGSPRLAAEMAAEGLRAKADGKKLKAIVIVSSPQVKFRPGPYVS